jgi:ribosomal protein L24E
MSKITKSRKRRTNTVQYRKNPQKKFFLVNKKGGEKFPWAFFFCSKQCSKKMSKITKSWKKLNNIKLFRYKVREIC